MSESLLHESWYRVAALKPSVRSHVQFHRHCYRGQLWYVLQDHSSARAHRLTPGAYHIAALMDGERTTQDIWEAANTRLGDDGPTQGETLRLLGLLHAADVLRCDISPDTAELLRRSRRKQVSEWWRPLLSPLSVRVPLADPDAFLERWLPWVRPLFSWPAAVIWALVVVAATLGVIGHWHEVTAGAASDLLDPRNLVLLWFIYPIVKGLHELGHAFATKVWGGEVHEMGIMFLVLIPIPYVDASAASVFPDKRRRMVVSAAGMMVELFLAALAFAVWLELEPGALRLAAYNVMWIGGASTVLFNGNPLLRFDGYYLLADAIEIPNLSARAQQYLAWGFKRHVLGMQDVRYPVLAPGEGRWFLFYGVAAFVYRFVVLFGIALFVAGRFFIVGVALAAMAVVMGVVVPLLRQAVFLFADPRLAGRRGRPLLAVGALVAFASLLLGVVPLPLLTRADGVVWPAEGTQVRARADGFVVRALVPAGTHVEPGDALLLTRAPSLEARVAVLAAELREQVARHDGQRRDRVRAQITLEEMQVTRAALAQARERAGEVVIRSPAAGRFVAPRAPADLVGRFLKEGELIGYVVGGAPATARVVLTQSDIALVRERTLRVQLRLAERFDAIFDTEVLREVPEATLQLPSAALGLAAGGRLPVDPTDPSLAREPVFQVDVALPPQAAGARIGGRVHVRFEHGNEPVFGRLRRALRRLFLNRLGV